MTQPVAANNIEFPETEMDLYLDEFSEKEEASIWLIELAIQSLLREAPKHLLNRKPGERRFFAESVLIASSLHSNVPWGVVLGVAFAESSLRSKARGNIGERGVMQVHGVAWKYCRKMLTFLDKSNVEHQLICGSIWLEHSMNQCDGSVYQGMARYMTGNVCKPKKGGKLDRQINRRLRKIQEISGARLDVETLKRPVY